MASSRVGALFAALSGLREVSGHGWASNPPARNSQSGPKNGYCPHCGNGNGICGDGNQWPAGSDYENFYNGPVKTWNEGSIVSVEVKITAHHKGHFEFSLCDKVINSQLPDAQGCLDKNILQRASATEAGVTNCQAGDSRSVCQPIDPRHPERYYLPPGSGSDTIYLKLPKGVTCDACTVQWRWWSANSCIPATDYACFKSELEAAGFDAVNWGLGNSCPGGGCDRCGCGEEFRNCIDVSITAGDGKVTIPTTSPPPPSTVTTTAVTTTMVTTTSQAISTSQPSMCTAVPVNGASFGATDEKCNKACEFVPLGEWPCSASGPCNCMQATTPTTTPAPTTSMTPAPAPTTTTGGSSQCGTCQGCLWTAHNACYKDWTKTTCDRYIADGYQWCA